MIDRLERQRRHSNGIELLYTLVFSAFRMRQRIQYWKLHARHAHLCDHASIHELHERMDYALRMYDNVDAIVGKTKKEMRLDHLERFVRECSRIDGDLASHRPGWMSQRILESRLLELMLAPSAKRTSRGGEDYAFDFRARSARDALKNRAVL